jgi:4-diphosphocytidyl-2-C-methyl-D-erythritol kinase
VSSGRACAKINLGLVVGPLRADGKHEVVTALVRIDLYDTVEVETTRSGEIVVEGFEDTIVRRALEELTRRAGESRGWQVAIDKRIPVAAGLGGGSADAGTALRLANELLDTPLSGHQLHDVAADIGADVPFFLGVGPTLATGDGTELVPISIPLDFWVVLVMPSGIAKTSTADVYRAFDDQARCAGFEERCTALMRALHRARVTSDLAALPHNDLVTSPVTDDLVTLGALHADVTGAGPAVYGLFEDRGRAERASRELEGRGQRWVVRPAPVS